MKKISTEKAPAAIGPYSQGVVVNNTLFSSGQIALDPATGEIVGSTIEEQAEQVMKNLGAILEEAGSSYELPQSDCYKAPVLLQGIPFPSLPDPFHYNHLYM